MTCEWCELPRSSRALRYCSTWCAGAARAGKPAAPARAKWSRDSMLHEWDALREQGYSRLEAARRLGVSWESLERAIYRGRAAGDPRAVLGRAR